MWGQIAYIAGSLVTCFVLGKMLWNWIKNTVRKSFNLAKTWNDVVDSVKQMAATLQEIKDMLHAGEIRMTKSEGRIDALEQDHKDTKHRVDRLEGKVFGCIIMLSLLLPSLAHAGAWTSQMDMLARSTETRYHLPHGTCRAFALQESGYSPQAYRVETGYFNQGSRYYRKVVASSQLFAESHAGSDPVTEQAYESISFGMFQLMGFNLRSLGCQRIVLTQISLDEQFEYFGRFVSPLFKRYGSLARVASAYNTGSPNKTGRQYVKNVCRYQRLYSY